MDYTPTISDLDSRQRLLESITSTATLAARVQPQATLNPQQREAITKLREAAAAVRDCLAAK